MGETAIRFMRLKDVDAVAAIEQATFARPWSRDSFRRELTRNAVARYLVAEENGEILGYADSRRSDRREYLLCAPVVHAEEGSMPRKTLEPPRDAARLEGTLRDERCRLVEPCVPPRQRLRRIDAREQLVRAWRLPHRAEVRIDEAPRHLVHPLALDRVEQRRHRLRRRAEHQPVELLQKRVHVNLHVPAHLAEHVVAERVVEESVVLALGIHAEYPGRDVLVVLRPGARRAVRDVRQLHLPVLVRVGPDPHGPPQLLAPAADLRVLPLQILRVRDRPRSALGHHHVHVVRDGDLRYAPVRGVGHLRDADIHTRLLEPVRHLHGASPDQLRRVVMLALLVGGLALLALARHEAVLRHDVHPRLAERRHRPVLLLVAVALVLFTLSKVFSRREQ